MTNIYVCDPKLILKNSFGKSITFPKNNFKVGFLWHHFAPHTQKRSKQNNGDAKLTLTCHPIMIANSIMDNSV